MAELLGWPAQPLRLARRRRVPDLGLQSPVSAARPRRHAPRGGAPRGVVCGRRDDGGRRSRLGRRPPAAAHRAGARLVCRLHGRRRPRCARAVAGARAQESPRGTPAPSSSLACLARPADGHDGRGLARRADGGDRPRACAVAGAGARCFDRRHCRALGPRRLGSLSQGACRAAGACRRARPRRGRHRHRPSAWAALRPRRMRLLLVGTSHRLAPVEVRERVALDPDGEAALARRLGEGGEAVCLSTCNRTELYLAAADTDAAGERATAELADLGGIPRAELEPYLYRLEQEAAAAHLFRVAAGLDSLIPGEGEIQGQVRSAYERGAVGPLLDRLFRHALHTGKRVRSETAIGESPASVASAAAALAAQVFGDLAGRRILVIGTGKIGELAARNLVKRGAELSFVANRTFDRASSLAERFGGSALPLESVEQELAQADIVVSSTSAREQILAREQVERALPARKGRPLLLVDLAVPRDLDPGIRELHGCFLYDIDDLQAVVEETLSGRRGEAALAE